MEARKDRQALSVGWHLALWYQVEARKDRQALSVGWHLALWYQMEARKDRQALSVGWHLALWYQVYLVLTRCWDVLGAQSINFVNADFVNTISGC